MFRTILAVSLLILSACDSGPGVTYGPAQLRVTAGDGQTHVAAVNDSLDAPVVSQLYQVPESGITLRLVTPLHAQTNVQGVKGHQVCAVPVGNGNGLQPWNPCAITDTAGIAVFWFDPQQKAGVHCSEIRAVVAGERVVADSVCATVKAGPWRPLGTRWGGGSSGILDANNPIQPPRNTFIDQYFNEIEVVFQVTGPFQVVTGRDGRQGIARLPDSISGQSGVVTMLRKDDGALLITATGTLTASTRVPGTWDLDLTY